MKKQPLLFALARAAHTATREDYWRHINSRARSRPTLRVDAPELKPGTVLNATDRAYIVTNSGPWRVFRTFNECEQLPAHKSQIRLLPEIKPVRKPATCLPSPS